jgi:hypothetical protein
MRNRADFTGRVVPLTLPSPPEYGGRGEWRAARLCVVVLSPEYGGRGDCGGMVQPEGAIVDLQVTPTTARLGPAGRGSNDAFDDFEFKAKCLRNRKQVGEFHVITRLDVTDRGLIRDSCISSRLDCAISASD